MQWAYLSIIEVSFRFGNSSGSAFGYVLYGAQMVSEHRYKEAYRFGAAALKITHRFEDEKMLPKVHNPGTLEFQGHKRTFEALSQEGRRLR